MRLLTRFGPLAIAVAVAMSLVLPVVALAGGDQVQNQMSRPDEAGYFGPGGLSSAGERPDWAGSGGPRF